MSTTFISSLKNTFLAPVLNEDPFKTNKNSTPVFNTLSNNTLFINTAIAQVAFECLKRKKLININDLYKTLLEKHSINATHNSQFKSLFIMSILELNLMGIIGTYHSNPRLAALLT